MTPLYSMTGFGKSVAQWPGKKVTIEIKGLNSKQTDINLRVSSEFRSQEGAIRQVLSEALQRGKIDCTIFSEVTGLESAPQINEELAIGYMNQLKRLAEKTGAAGDIIGAVMRLQDVMQSAEGEMSEKQWQQLRTLLEETVEQMQGFRADEGARLKEDLALRVKNISEKLAQVDQFEEERKERVKERLQNSLKQLQAEADKDRFEQELIYYLEKFDVTEEKVRLASHLNYFTELMDAGGVVGKKLGFVGQEMGREINTLGSKANHAGLQKVVVEMKDELEKIKEQVLNIL